MEENQNNDINDVQEDGGVSEGSNENLGLEGDLQEDLQLDPSIGGGSDVLGLVPGVGVRNIMIQDPVEQQEETPVESVVETSTEVVDSMEEDTESYMEDEAV
jgi:hypothetical protein